MKEYAIYPFQNMNISQNWNQGNHIPHWKNSKNYSDKPWDEAGKDSGREYFIPQNDFLVEEVLGLNNNITNSVRLRSVNKLFIPYKDESDYLYLTLTHMNEDNLRQVKKGQILKKGTKILLEGTDGVATGNHFHITANLGYYHGLLQNSNGSWCYVYDKSLLPEEAFYLDKTKTKVIQSRGSVFQEVPTGNDSIPVIGTPVLKDETRDQLEITIKNLRGREAPSLEGKVLGYLTPGIYNYTQEITNDNYRWFDIGDCYVAYMDTWMTLYPKKQEELTPIPTEEMPPSIPESPKEENPLPSKPTGKKSFITILLEFFQNLIQKLWKK